MAEELEKYKQILNREDEEFREAMKAEVNQSEKNKTLAKHVLLPIYIEFCNFLLIDILFPSYHYYYITLF